MDHIPVVWLEQLQREPALWIRPKQGLETRVVPNLGKCEPAAIENFGIKTNAHRYTGITDLYRTDEFQAGEFEIQDLTSQLVGHAAAPKPGETWWDACAGEGGKTMHLSDLMQNKGLLWASDRSLRRLAKLKERAARAKVFNFRATQWEGTTKLPTKAKFDGILIDAPCSGIGTWQRNPHARWTTSPKDVHELAAVQNQLLEAVSGSLKPGGRLVYAVCTLSRAETTAIANAFTAAHPELTPDPVLGRTPQLTLWPQDLNANGMFIAAWRRR
jgi:16S rRNA (cytosine967-C5)-methyltransferase